MPPLLYEMLNVRSGLLVGSVAAGVGIATVLGIYHFVRRWSLKTLLLPTLALALVLTVIATLDPSTAALIALAWDTGAVTTGPVTVPLVLALGLGVSAVRGESDTGMSGFGVVTLASLWPVNMVLGAALLVHYTGAPLAPVAMDAPVGVDGSLVGLFSGSVQAAMQAVVPLVLILMGFQCLVLREPIERLDEVALGVAFCLLGLALFTLGLNGGLVPLGQQVGENLPRTFALPQQLYGEMPGRVVAIAFAFALGYAATLAEPALNALGITVEEVTAGAFKRRLLMHAVAAGVAGGLAFGLSKVLFDWPLAMLLVPAYLILVVLTLLNQEEFINIGWDSAGVTTGPITVPLVLAMGLGVGTSVNVADGFGMLALASVGPIFTVLVLGVTVSRAQRRAQAPAP